MEAADTVSNFVFFAEDDLVSTKQHVSPLPLHLIATLLISSRPNTLKMSSWISNISLRKLSGSVFSGYHAENGGNVSAPVFDNEPERPRTPSPEQVASETAMGQFLKQRKECIQRRKGMFFDDS